MLEINQLELDHHKLLCDLFCLDCDGVEQFSLLAGFMPTEDNLMRQIWEDPDYESGLISGAFVDGELVGFCVGVRRPWKSGRETTGYIKWIYVAPEFRRQRIGTKLLQETESAMLSRGVTEVIYGNSAPIYLWPGVGKNDEAMQSLLGKGGWVCGSERINLMLSLPMAMLASPTVAADVEVRLVVSDDERKLKEFVFVNFSESWWKEIEAIFNSESSAFSVIACCNGEVVGFASVGATNSSWFGPMGVGEQFRGRGIGKILLLKSINEATFRGENQLTIPWVNEAFYNRCLGKMPRQEFFKYSKKQ